MYGNTLLLWAVIPAVFTGFANDGVHNKASLIVV
jgi:hypothetical protein